MGFKDFIDRMRENNQLKKQRLKEALDEDRVAQIVEERRMSSNEREFHRFMKEKKEAMLIEELKELRRQREDDIRFNHNPLNIKNITAHTGWEVMKEPNLFSGERAGASILHQRNLFVGQRNIFAPRMQHNHYGPKSTLGRGRVYVKRK